MIRTIEEIERRLMAIWPNLYHKWPSDRSCWAPALADFSAVVGRSDVKTLPYRERICECEEYTRLLCADVTRHLIDAANTLFDAGRPLPDRLAYSWAFGPAKGLNFSHLYNGNSHDLVFVDLEEGVYLLEPQTYQIWRPGVSRSKKDPDFVYFIEL